MDISRCIKLEDSNLEWKSSTNNLYMCINGETPEHGLSKKRLFEIFHKRVCLRFSSCLECLGGPCYYRCWKFETWHNVPSHHILPLLLSHCRSVLFLSCPSDIIPTNANWRCAALNFEAGSSFAMLLVPLSRSQKSSLSACDWGEKFQHKVQCYQSCGEGSFGYGWIIRVNGLRWQSRRHSSKPVW